MSVPQNATILETVIEELEAEKARGNVSNQKLVQKTKPGKISRNRICKSKKQKTEKKPGDANGNDSKKILIVEIPNEDKDVKQHGKEEMKDTDEETGTKVLKQSINSATRINKNESITSFESRTETGSNSSRTNNDDVDGVSSKEENQNANKLFTRVFSVPKKELISSKNDIIITPNLATESEISRTKSQSENKENQLHRVKYTRSEEFIRSNSDKSILTLKSEPGLNKLPKHPRKQRPKSTSALSKRSLEAYLPRKSFFSSHDKVLREAGFQVDDAMKNKKRPNWKLILRMHTEEELNPVLDKEPEKSIVFEPQIKEESDEEASESTNLMDAVETLVSQEKEGQLVKRKLKLAAKKFGLEEKCDYKPLLEYLKYINEHPEEYMSMTRYSTKNMDYKHPSVMVRMARVYRKAHHGTARNNIFTHALAGLKPKFIDSSSSSQRHGRSEHSRNEFGATKKDQTEGSQEQTGASQDEGKTEIEKLKIKTEKWMGSLSTIQLLKAKECALKDMGEEDITVTKWWLAFKTCHYLRIPPTVIEQAL